MGTRKIIDTELGDFEGLDLETILEKLCKRNCHQGLIIFLTSSSYYSATNDLIVDLLETAISIRQCPVCCDLLINFSSGVSEDGEERFLEQDDEVGNQLLECYLPRLQVLVIPKNWTIYEAEQVILLAIRLNQIEVVRLVLQKYPNLISSNTVYGQSLLVHAVICKSFDIARFLSDLHIDYDNVALQVACSTKNCPLDIVETLLSMAEKNNELKLASLQRPLLNAAKRRRLDIVKQLLDKDITLIKKPLNTQNWSLLHCILAHPEQRDEMLEYVFSDVIVTNELNFLLQTDEGDTILHFAIMHRAEHRWISKLLNHCTELVERPNLAQVTPLMLAAKFNDFLTVELLIDQHNVNVNAQDMGGKTALEYAVWNDNVEIAKWLLEYGAADVFLTNTNGNNIFKELMKSLRYGINDDNGKIEILCDLMRYTYPPGTGNVKKNFAEIFSLFFKTIECLPRFEVLQSWIHTCYLNETNCFRNVIEEFMEEFQLEEYVERNILVLCLHEYVKDVSVEISIQIKLSEELGRCIEDAIYYHRDMPLIIKVADILKRNNVINSGISMRQNLFFPHPRPDISQDELKSRLKTFYRAFSRLGLIHIDKTVKYCISEILFNSQQSFENKIFQIESGILQSQMELMTDEPTPISTNSDIDLARNWITKEDVLNSNEYKLVKKYLSPKYINYLTESKEMLPLQCLCRSAFRSGLFDNVYNKSSSVDLLEAKEKFRRIMKELKVPTFLRNFLNYQY